MNKFKSFSSNFLLVLLISILFINACENNDKNNKQSNAKTTETIDIYKQISPNFNADSVYYFIEKQVEFGPRVTASKASLACGNFIKNEFEKQGASVITQKGTVTNWDKRKINIINIIAQINLKATKRILITAHWDSRPYADNDPIEANKTKPVLAADDGASGVGILTELASNGYIVFALNSLDESC
jgi:hypothetical protein